MKKNYIYLTLLIVATVLVTLVLAGIYKSEVESTTIVYDKMNKIKADEYDEYIMENQDILIYIADKNDMSNIKKEKSFIKKLEKLNLLEYTIYIDKEEFNKELEKKFKKNYSYEYEKNKLPVVLVINDGELSQISYIDSNSDILTLIDYEVFK